MGIPEVFGRLGVVADRGDIIPDLRLRKYNTDLHLCSFLACDRITPDYSEVW
jgi:hypothetical protein